MTFVPSPLGFICWLRALLRSVRLGAPVSGHSLVQVAEPTPPNIVVCRCSTCGYVIMQQG